MKNHVPGELNPEVIPIGALLSNVWQEVGYRVTFSPTESELLSAYRLRADVFCRELKWVGSPDQDIERDDFDAEVVHLALLVREEVAAYLRIHAHKARWMAYSVFGHVVPQDKEFRTAGCCEASRLAVAPKFRRHTLPDGRHPADALFDALYTYCVLTGIHTTYMITSYATLKALRRRRLPCEPIGPNVIRQRGPAPIFAKVAWSGYSPARSSLAQALPAEREAPRRPGLPSRLLDVAPQSF